MAAVNSYLRNYIRDKRNGLYDSPPPERRRKMYTRLTPAEIRQIKYLHKHGWGTAEIAAEVGCGESAVINHTRKKATG